MYICFPPEFLAAMAIFRHSAYSMWYSRARLQRVRAARYKVFFFRGGCVEMYTHVCICIHMYVYVYTCMYMYVLLRTYIHALCMYIHMYIDTHTHTHTHIHAYLYGVCVGMYACMYVYI
jgi:hypothetical protein